MSGNFLVTDKSDNRTVKCTDSLETEAVELFAQLSGVESSLHVPVFPFSYTAGERAPGLSFVVSRVTRKHLPPVHGPPLRTGSVDYLRTGPRTTPTDPSTHHPQK